MNTVFETASQYFVMPAGAVNDTSSQPLVSERSIVAAASMMSGVATVRVLPKETVNVSPETPFVAAKMFSEPRTMVYVTVSIADSGMSSFAASGSSHLDSRPVVKSPFSNAVLSASPMKL